MGTLIGLMGGMALAAGSPFSLFWTLVFVVFVWVCVKSVKK